jgi:hypothetical protein
LYGTLPRQKILSRDASLDNVCTDLSHRVTPTGFCWGFIFSRQFGSMRTCSWDVFKRCAVKNDFSGILSITSSMSLPVFRMAWRRWRFIMPFGLFG